MKEKKRSFWKQIVSGLLVASMVVSVFPGNMFVKASTETEGAAVRNLNAHLMAHWDFEGEGEEVFEDKSTRPGNIADNLYVISSTTEISNPQAQHTANASDHVEVTNGVATIKAGTGIKGALMALNSSDLNPSDEMTIFLRAKMGVGACVDTALVDKGVIPVRPYRMILKQSPYWSPNFQLGVQASAGGSIFANKTESAAAVTHEWQEFALVISRNDAGQLTTTIYASVGADTASGADFVEVSKVESTSTAAIDSNTQPLLLGNDLNMKNEGFTREFEDIRIYDTALTTDEMAGLVKKDLNKNLMAHWDFEGTGEEVFADKATKGNHADDLYVVSSTADVSAAQAQHTANASNYVEVKDGVANFKTGAPSALMALNSTDLNPTKELTIFFRAKMGGGQEMDTAFVDKGLAARSYRFLLKRVPAWNPPTQIKNQVYVGGTLASNPGLTSVEPVTNGWHEYAMVVSRNADNCVVVTMYVSRGAHTETGADFVRVGEPIVTTGTADLSTTTLPLLLGNDYNMSCDALERSMDEIRIYDTALTTNELAEAVQRNPEAHLMAHWDFEGEGNEVFADKSTRPGNIADDLYVVSSGAEVSAAQAQHTANAANYVEVEDGVANFKTGASSALMALNSTDLSPTNELTIFFRAQMGAGQEMDTAFIDKGISTVRPYRFLLKRVPVWNPPTQIKNQVSVGGSLVSNPALTSVEPVTNGWHEYAMVISRNVDNSVVVTMYVSTGANTEAGTDFVQVGEPVVSTSKANLDANTLPLLIGNDCNMSCDVLERSMDEIRIYNMALTTDELAGLIQKDLNDNLMAHWDFEGEGEEVFADKSTRPGNIEDNLYVISSTTEISNPQAQHTANASDHVEVKNGVATLKVGTDIKSALMALNSSDLNPSDEMTIFLRAKMGAGACTDTALVDKGVIPVRPYRMILKQSPYWTPNFQLGVQASAGGSIFANKTESAAAVTHEWQEFALVISRNDAGQLTTTIYASVGADTASGADFVEVSKVESTNTAAIDSNTNPLVIGDCIDMKNAGFTREFDDVRIYDTALTTDEMAGLIQPKSDYTVQMNLTDSIAMDYIVKLDKKTLELGDPKMTFSVDGEKTTVDGVKVSGVSRTYKFTCSNIMAQDMAKDITAVLNVGGHKETKSYSVLKYCASLLGAQQLQHANGSLYTGAQLMATKELIVDLVQYGAQVQTYRGISGEELLTAQLAAKVPTYEDYENMDVEVADLANLTAVASKLTSEAGIAASDAYAWKSVGLVLGNKVKIRGTFTASDVSNLTVKVAIDGVELEDVLEITEASAANTYTVDFDEIYAYEYGKEISFRFYDGATQVGKTLNYSVNTYLKEMNATTYPGLAQLLVAICNYGDAAVAVKNGQ